MKALLLAGGLGTRLRPLTENLPKPMAPIANKPWLEHLIIHLRKQGVDQFVVACHHYSEVIRNYFGEGQNLGVKMEYAIEPFPMGTAGAIKNAKDFFHETFLVVNADIVHLPELLPLLEFHYRHKGMATIALTEVEDPTSYGVVEQDKNGQILRFVEKPSREEAPSNRINAGLYVLEPSIMNHIPSNQEVSIERQTFPFLIENKTGVYGKVINGYWFDMGTPSRYRQIHWDVLDRRSPLTIMGREYQKGVWIGEGSKIGNEVRFIPPVLIGKSVKVGDKAVIGPYAVIGDHCHIGKGVKFSSSILWDRSTIGDHCQIKESILAHKTSLSSGKLLNHSIINQSEKVMYA